ncbi:MAG: hypothetical protein B6245_09365 [Desulfobacteraceae bacterium 4572_88]|nr:MAG: hypothetical protein B6245_09365 [Desulfobacteraceae bacterium 4572_88]
MNTHEAIIAFSQSEKIKSGIIWVTNALELFGGLPPQDKPGGEKIIKMIVGMIAHEVHLAKRLTKDAAWDSVENPADMAMVMINSGVPQEASFHLTQALRQVTNIGQRSMSFLKEKALL